MIKSKNVINEGKTTPHIFGPNKKTVPTEYTPQKHSKKLFCLQKFIIKLQPQLMWLSPHALKSKARRHLVSYKQLANPSECVRQPGDSVSLNFKLAFS